MGKFWDLYANYSVTGLLRKSANLPLPHYIQFKLIRADQLHIQCPANNGGHDWGQGCLCLEHHARNNDECCKLHLEYSRSGQCSKNGVQLYRNGNRYV